MKNLVNYIGESFFDTINSYKPIKFTEKPKEYIFNLQAWESIIRDSLEQKCSPEDIAMILKLYKDSRWHLDFDYDPNEDYEMIGMDEMVKFPVAKTDSWSDESFDELLDDLIKDFSSGVDDHRLSPNGSGSILCTLFETPESIWMIGDQILSESWYANELTRKYYKAIKKHIEIVLGIKLK